MVHAGGHKIMTERVTVPAATDHSKVKSEAKALLL